MDLIKKLGVFHLLLMNVNWQVGPLVTTVGSRFVLPYGTPWPEACMNAVCTRVVSGQSQTPNRYPLGG